MSHVSKGAVQVRDLEALKAAVKSLGGIWRDKQTYNWYGRWVNDYHGEDAAYRQGIKPEDYGKCDFAIGVPGGTYEVGVVRTGDHWSLVYDHWGSGGSAIEKQFGKLCGKLGQQLGLEVAKKKLAAKGYSMTQRVVNGKIQLVASKVGG